MDKKKTSNRMVRCIETGQVFNSITEAANFINRRLQTLCGHLNGKSKTCAGYHWEYYYGKESEQ